MENPPAINDFTVQLPYFVPADELPAPLPSREDILHALRQKSPSSCFSSHGGRSNSAVVRIGPYVVKCGPRVNRVEGETMLYLEKAAPSVKIPKVYAFYGDKIPNELDRDNFLIMEYIDGKDLWDTYETLSDATKESVAAQLKTAIDTLRRLPSPGGYCAIGRQSLNNLGLRHSSGEHKVTSVVFDTEKEFNEFWVRSELRSPCHSPRKIPAWCEVAQSVLSGFAPTFSHADFSPNNILLGNDGKITIIDWEFAGWYPAYWEFATAYQMVWDGGLWDAWDECTAQVLDPFYAQWLFKRGLRDAASDW